MFVHRVIAFKGKGLTVMVVSRLTESQAIQLYHLHRMN